MIFWHLVHSYLLRKPAIFTLALCWQVCCVPVLYANAYPTISFFQTLHAGQRFSTLPDKFFENMFPQLSHIFKSSSVIIIVLPPQNRLVYFLHGFFHESKLYQKYPSILPNENCSLYNCISD